MNSATAHLETLGETTAPLSRSALHQLCRMRWLLLGLLALLVVLTPLWLAVPLPQAGMLLVIAIAAALNARWQSQLRRQPSLAPGELCSQLLLDIATLGALIFFSGGATNPLVSLLLPPVAIAALTLPRRHLLLVGGSALLAYSLLMVSYLPLPIADASRATQLHLTGMWLTFAVSALMIAWIIWHLRQQIHARDAELAAAREQALRDERVVAIGTLAAGAAHELGTPLATMALISGELAQDSQLSPEMRADVALIRQQIGICKDIVTALTRRAGSERLEISSRQPVDRWIDALRQKWHALRPQADSRLIVAGSAPAPAIVDDPRLEQAVLNLLNNAANACAQTLDIRVDWNAQHIDIEISDRGPGFPAAVLENFGRGPLTAGADGHGVGLLLTCSAIEQLGGQLLLTNPDDGGALARIRLPTALP